MGVATYNLAIETSSGIGSVTLGCGRDILATRLLEEQRRHAVELMPTIDQLCRQHGVQPRQLSDIYISIGPGSFTGLRISVSTAKMLGYAIGCRLVPVPTLDVVAQNVAGDTPHLAVLLNAKRGIFYSGIYRRDGGRWIAESTPGLRTCEQVLEESPRPLAVVGDRLREETWPAHVDVLPSDLAVPHSEVVWRLGEERAAADRYVEPAALVPLYVRLPEAVELWRARQKAKPRS